MSVVVEAPRQRRAIPIGLCRAIPLNAAIDIEPDAGPRPTCFNDGTAAAALRGIGIHKLGALPTKDWVWSQALSVRDDLGNVALSQPVIRGTDLSRRAAGCKAGDDVVPATAEGAKNRVLCEWRV